MSPDDFVILSTATALWGLIASGLILGTIVSAVAVSKIADVWAHAASRHRVLVNRAASASRPFGFARLRRGQHV